MSALMLLLMTFLTELAKGLAERIAKSWHNVKHRVRRKQKC